MWDKFLKSHEQNIPRYMEMETDNLVTELGKTMAPLNRFEIAHRIFVTLLGYLFPQSRSSFSDPNQKYALIYLSMVQRTLCHTLNSEKKTIITMEKADAIKHISRILIETDRHLAFKASPILTSAIILRMLPKFLADCPNS
ncbi:MAG: hypothetical protein SF123_17150 [Chloroflexota bacterium]|nr:hypothetical protein [Chloroflexota bacterium]